jgi:hypothetical protein
MGLSHQPRARPPRDYASERYPLPGKRDSKGGKKKVAGRARPRKVRVAKITSKTARKGVCSSFCGTYATLGGLILGRIVYRFQPHFILFPCPEDSKAGTLILQDPLLHRFRSPGSFATCKPTCCHACSAPYFSCGKGTVSAQAAVRITCDMAIFRQQGIGLDRCHKRSP